MTSSLLGVLASLAMTAGAELHLTWSAPSGCPSVDEVRAEIERHRPSDVRTPFSVSAVVTRSAAAFHVEVATQGRSGKQGLRVVTMGSCEEAVRAVAAIAAIGWAAEVDAGHRAPVVSRAGEPPAQASASAPTATWRFGLAGGAQGGVFPAVAGVVDGTTSLTLRVLRFAAAIGLLLPQRQEAGPTRSSSVQYSALTGRLCAGPTLVRATFEAGVCGGLEASLIWARSAGVRSPEGGAALSLALAVSAFLRREVTSNLGVGVTAALDTTVLRPRFAFDGQAPVHAVAAVGGHLLLGVEWTIP